MVKSYNVQCLATESHRGEWRTTEMYFSVALNFFLCGSLWPELYLNNFS